MPGFGFGSVRAAQRRASGIVPPAPPPAPPPPPPPPPQSVAPVIVAILAGQSNMEGRAGREAQDVDVTGAVQFVGSVGAPGYRTLSADISPIFHADTLNAGNGADGFLGPGEYLARRLIADDLSANVVLVGTAKGAQGMALPGDPWFPGATPGSGGELFENMVEQANRATAAATAAWPGRPVRPVFLWVQGEQDAELGRDRETYLASLKNLIALARARVDGAGSATFVIGSMVPEKWHPSSPTRNPAYAGINAAHVDASLTVEGVRYARGPDYVDGGRDFLHYLAPQRVRDQGAALGMALSDAAGPAVTSAQAASTTVGDRLALALAGDDAHMTFHLNGGADAARFEVSDPYLAPTLRWAGDGTGPAAGSYAVRVRGRDGAGNYGTDRTVSVTVANAYGVGDQGPTGAVFTGVVRDGGAHFGSASFALADVPLGKGLNLIHFVSEGGSGDVTGVTINGKPATRLADGSANATGTVYGFVAGAAGAVTATIATGSGNGAVVNLTLTIVTLTGTKVAPVATDVLPLGSRNNPLAGAALACPGEGMPGAGIIVGLGGVGGPTTANAGTTMLTSQASSFAAMRATSGAISVTGTGTYSHLVTLVFEKSG